MTKQSAFTLIEMMIVIALIAIVAGIAAPNLSMFTKNSALSGASEELLNTLGYAKSEAIKRGGAAHREQVGVDEGEAHQHAGAVHPLVEARHEQDVDRNLRAVVDRVGEQHERRAAAEAAVLKLGDALTQLKSAA